MQKRNPLEPKREAAEQREVLEADVVALDAQLDRTAERLQEAQRRLALPLGSHGEPADCLESLHTACVHSSAPSGQSLWARACMLLVMLAESYCECRTSVHHACLCAELRALAVVWCGIVSRLVW